MPRPITARSLGMDIGTLPPGPLNAISDIDGVTVGHVTRETGDARTGVTVILPHPGNVFRDKVLAASHVINGFGKSVGLMQIDELGQIETPIALTNTLSVGTCATALIKHAIRANPDIGRRTSTVNPVVCECNDGYLNDIQGFHVAESDVEEAIRTAQADFTEGDVGAGKGMSAFELKGGIGAASRRIALDGETYHLGALVLSNFGRRQQLRIAGRPVGDGRAGSAASESGSVIIVLATDVPLEHRQLRRVARRGGVGLCRVGSYLGHGSGDVVVAFTTANRINHDESRDLLSLGCLNEMRIDRLFQATAESVEEAVINSMLAAETVSGFEGHRRESLARLMDRANSLL
ncbi:MAG: P1 family peptidase [Proteobacteria bacterium]|nr:P1 family peptidase [Pseudomonadota bacterium]MBI3495959.1 P1 family peptidase [Pseudomonadota bacterium]